MKNLFLVLALAFLPMHVYAEMTPGGTGSPATFASGAVVNGNEIGGCTSGGNTCSGTTVVAATASGCSGTTLDSHTAHWMRVGSHVTVSGSPGQSGGGCAAGGAYIINIPVVGANFSSVTQGAGVGACKTTSSDMNYIFTSKNASTQVDISVAGTVSCTSGITYSYTYEIQ